MLNVITDVAEREFNLSSCGENMSNKNYVASTNIRK